MVIIDLNRIGAQTFTRFVEYHESLPSTNDLAMKLAIDPRTETPLLILAGEQTAGRGRGQNRWWSGAGALTFTVVFDAEDFSLPPPRWPCVALAAGLAVCDIVPQFVSSSECRLKWPNDVWLSSRKLCGILVEVPPCRPPVPPRLVVGVGLNVNNSANFAPPEFRDRAISLRDAAGEDLSPTDVLIAFLNQFSANAADLGLREGPAPRLVDRWQRHCVLTGRSVTIDAGTTVFTGLCRGIEPDGSLLVETPHGMQRIYGGTVQEIG